MERVELSLNYLLHEKGLNEGFFNEPTSPIVNAYLAMIAQQEGDTEKCQTHIDIAKANNPDELVAALIAAIEGGGT